MTTPAYPLDDDPTESDEEYDYSDIYVTVTKGMPTSSHLLHIALVIVTCGLWLPVYGVLAVVGRKRATVMAPAGTPQHIVDQVAVEAEMETPEETRSRRRAVGIAVGIIVAVVVVPTAIVLVTVGL
jgi:uncharacterized membrane protein